LFTHYFQAYKKVIPLQTIRQLSETTREGNSFLGLSDAAERIGFKTLGLKINFETLAEEIQLPCAILELLPQQLKISAFDKNKEIT